MKGIVAYEARDYCNEFNHNWCAFKVSNRYFEKAGHVCLLKLASANAALHFTQGASTQHGVKHFFWLIDVNAYYAELINKKAKITHEIGDRDYGIRDFGLADNNGFTLIFGQDVD